jgi:hypothetical protein
VHTLTILDLIGFISSYSAAQVFRIFREKILINQINSCNFHEYLVFEGEFLVSMSCLCQESSMVSSTLRTTRLRIIFNVPGCAFEASPKALKTICPRMLISYSLTPTSTHPKKHQHQERTKKNKNTTQFQKWTSTATKLTQKH